MIKKVLVVDERVKFAEWFRLAKGLQWILTTKINIGAAIEAVNAAQHSIQRKHQQIMSAKEIVNVISENRRQFEEERLLRQQQINNLSFSSLKGKSKESEIANESENFAKSVATKMQTLLEQWADNAFVEKDNKEIEEDD